MHARWRRTTYVQCLQAGKALVAPGTETPGKESNEGEDGMGVTLKRQSEARTSIIFPVCLSKKWWEKALKGCKQRNDII